MLKKAYRDLIKSVSDDDIVIFAESEGPCSSLTRGENGAFETSWQGNGPRILIVNKTRVNFQPKLGALGIQKFDEFVETLVNDAAHDLVSAVYTLAHEYGHFRSYQSDGLYAVDGDSFRARQSQAMDVYRQILKMI